MSEVTSQLKRCCLCGQRQPRACFTRDKSRLDGLDNRCRRCRHAMRENNLTATRLLELLTYDSSSGRFHDRTTGEPVPVTLHKSGYVQLTIDGCTHFAHRVAWLAVTGEWPPHQIDHRDLDRSNNRWTNLRSATPSQNVANRRAMANNKLGIKGVIEMPSGKFRAQCNAPLSNKPRILGTFATVEEAAAAYSKAAVERWGEYAPRRCGCAVSASGIVKLKAEEKQS